MTRERLEQLLALEDADFITSANVAFADIKEEMKKAGYPTNPDGYRKYTASNPDTADLFKKFSDRTLKINKNKKTKAIPLPKKAKEAANVEPEVIVPNKNIAKDVEDDEVVLAPFANNGAKQVPADQANTEAIPVVAEEAPEASDTKKVDVYEKNSNGKKWAKRAAVVALAGAALLGGIKLGEGCVSRNVATQPTANTETAKEEASESEFVNNADQMMQNAANVLNETRAYGNNATSKEMFEFMLVANYNDISKDPNFLANLQMNLTTDEQKAFVENFLGSSDLNDIGLNTTLSQDDLQRIFNQKGAMDNLILSYSVELNDQDVVANKKLSNYSSLFVNADDKAYINQLMNYINDATYNSGDSAKVKADLDAASQLVSNSVKDGSKIGYGAQYTGITIFNDIMNYKFTDSIDDSITQTLTVCKGNMEISKNAENVAFKVRQQADGILLKLQEGQTIEYNAANGKKYDVYLGEIDGATNVKYVSAIDRANGNAEVTNDASNSDSSSSAYVDESAGSGNVSTWTTETETTESNSFEAQPSAEQEATNEETNKEIAADKKQATSEANNKETGTTAQTTADGSGTISAVTADGETKKVDISSTDTADQIDQKIADATGDTKAEVDSQRVYDEQASATLNNGGTLTKEEAAAHTEKNADGSQSTIGQVIIENDEDVKKAAAAAQAQADALAAQGYVETTNDNVVGNNQAAVATPQASASSLSK